MQNKEYANRWGISQTILKDFRFKSPKRWYQIWIEKQEDLNKNEDGFVLGSLCDTLMFSPELLEERFYVSTQKLPSKAIESIVREFYRRMCIEKEFSDAFVEDLPDAKCDFDMEKTYKVLLSCADDYINEEGKKGWNNTWKTETRVKSLFEKGQGFLNDLVLCGDRKIISQEMNFEAMELKDILLKDEETRPYFIADEGVELKFQLEIFAEYRSQFNIKLPLKGALDIVRIDHNTQTIQIVDFKTSLSSFGFIQSVKKYGYATQLSFYDYILRLWLDKDCEGKYCNYTILNPINIVIDKYDKVPYIYEYSWTDLEMERNGNNNYLESVYGGSHDHKIKKGWQELLEEISWHFYNEYWEKPRELFENRKIKINLLNS